MNHAGGVLTLGSAPLMEYDLMAMRLMGPTQYKKAFESTTHMHNKKKKKVFCES